MSLAGGSVQGSGSSGSSVDLNGAIEEVSAISVIIGAVTSSSRFIDNKCNDRMTIKLGTSYFIPWSVMNNWSEMNLMISACFEALQVHLRRQAWADTPWQTPGWGAPRQEDDQGQEGDLRVHREGRPGQDSFERRLSYAADSGWTRLIRGWVWWSER